VPPLFDGDRVFADPETEPHQVHDRFRVEIDELPVCQRTERLPADDFQPRRRIINAPPRHQADDRRKHHHPESAPERDAGVSPADDVARADQHIPPPAVEFGQHRAHLSRIVLAVGVEGDEPLVARPFRIQHGRLNRPTVPEIAEVDNHRRVGAVEDRGRRVARAIVDDDQIGVGQVQAHAFDDVADSSGLVVRRNGHQRAVAWRGRHTHGAPASAGARSLAQSGRPANQDSADFSGDSP
jgi:hypothetical protein